MQPLRLLLKPLMIHCNSPTMRYQLLPCLFLLIFCAITKAQPAPCGPDPAMTPTCLEACVICDINGYTGINNNPETGQAPPGFCTTTVHHIQWLAFIAGSTNLTIELKVFGCQNTGNWNGLEVGIYESLDCQTFNLVTNCDGDVNNNSTGVFTTTQPLNIGQYYYWVMDGNAGDVCNYTINVVEGSTQVPPLSIPVLSQVETQPCLNQPATYAIEPVSGANFYLWTKDGQPVGDSTATEITWTTPGLHQVCVTAYNVCDTTAPACLLVNVLPPIQTSLQENICEGDCIEVADTMICEAGHYEFHLISWQGCDSMVSLELSTISVVQGNLSATICETDSLQVAGQYFFPPGQFQATATSWLGCDSFINLNLVAIICEIQGITEATPLVCHGDQSGIITFSVTDGTPPFTYTWKELNGAPSGSGNIAAINQDETISNLPTGTYLITVSDIFGNDVVLITGVIQPPPLSLDWMVSDFNGYSVRCHGGQDGSISALVSGGTPPYSFIWNNGALTGQIDSLTAGTYEVTVTDAAGCTLMADNTLSQPLELLFTAQFNDPGCDGFNTGSVSITSVAGGTGSYLYNLSGSGFGTDQQFEGLFGGNYTLTVKDANDCTASETGILAVPAIPIIDAGEDVTIKLAETTRLDLLSSVPPASVAWSNLPGLSCYDCPAPDAMPFETTTYSVTVVSEDDCTATDSVTVQVLKVRDFYVPNAFSPNDDGINDVLIVYGGPAVTKVHRFLVFDRWGDLVYEGKNLLPNDISSGWDGVFKGKKMQPGVFGWLAEIVFIDGAVVMAEGDLNLVH